MTWYLEGLNSMSHEYHTILWMPKCLYINIFFLNLPLLTFLFVVQLTNQMQKFKYPTENNVFAVVLL